MTQLCLADFPDNASETPKGCGDAELATSLSQLNDLSYY